MKKLPILTILFFLVAAVATSGCKYQSEDPGGQPTSEGPKAGEYPGTARYPRLYQTYLDSGSKMESAMAFDWPAGPKVLQLFEGSFRKHIQLFQPDEESTFAIQRSESDSLLIQWLPQVANEPKAMVAIWARREKDDEGNSTTLRRVSPPLSGEEQALLLLKSYASGGEGLKSLLEWERS